jgi:hypothetical protein
MVRSPQDDIPSGHRSVPAAVAAVLPAVVGAVAALLIGLLTFGAQATAAPDGVPLAIGAADPAAAAALAPIAQRLAAEGGGAVAWRTVGSRAEAERLLDRKEVYGALLLAPGASGPTATVLLSGALNPSATQVAQPVLTQVGETVVAAARAQAGAQAAQAPAGAQRPQAAPAAAPEPAVRIETIHPTSAAGRILPLAASALLWLATLIAGVMVVVAIPRLRGGRPLGRVALLGTSVASALLGAAAVLGLAWAWDASLPLSWDVAGFLALAGLSFALLQAGVFRWLGIAGMAVLAPLYLMAPAVAGLVPELLHPAYREALWSWTPFRFSTEGLRSLLFLGRDAADVQSALWVLGAIAAVGLLLTIAPRPRARRAAGMSSAAVTR